MMRTGISFIIVYRANPVVAYNRNSIVAVNNKSLSASVVVHVSVYIKYLPISMRCDFIGHVHCSDYSDYCHATLFSA